MRTILIAWLVLSANAAFAQEADQVNPNAPGPLKKLGFCIGDWEIRPLNAPDGVKPVARMHAYWTLDGHALFADYRGLNRQGKVVFRGTSFRTYDPKNKKYYMKWMVAGKGDYTLISGNFENEALVTTGQGIDQRGDFIERYSFFDIKPNQFKFKLERSYDDGKSWQLHALNRYNRKK